MTALLLSCIFSASVIWLTANSSRHFRVFPPGLPDKIISPAIRRAKTSRMLGETDTAQVPSCIHLRAVYKTLPLPRFALLNYENQHNTRHHQHSPQRVVTRQLLTEKQETRQRRERRRRRRNRHRLRHSDVQETVIHQQPPQAVRDKPADAKQGYSPPAQLQETAFTVQQRR